MNRTCTSSITDCSLGLIAGALAVIVVQSYAPAVLATVSTSLAPLARHRSIVRAACVILGGVTATLSVGRWFIVSVFERGN